MTISILLMKQIAQLFLMIFMGYLIVKTGIVEDTDSKVLSKIILYLVIPCVIINAFQVDYTSDTVKGLLLAFIASVITQIILLIVISALGKLFHLNEVEIASIYYSNSGNLIVPIVTFILGKEWVLYGCVFMSVQLVFIWTHCKKIISQEASYDWKKIVLNINMISIFIGILLFFTKIHLPEIINDSISSVGNMIGPASMIVTGMLFAGMDLKQIFTNKKVYFISTTFEGGMREHFISIDSLELFDGSMMDLRQIINSIFDEYENEIISVTTDDHTIKVLEKLEDEEKIITRYAYLNREDEDLYRDLFED